MTQALSARGSNGKPGFPDAGAPPSGRASWMGFLRLGPITASVKAYSAIADIELPLHQLHAGCGQRIQYQKHCPVHGQVEQADIAKGYEHGPGQHVVLDAKAMEAIRPPTEKELVLATFVDYRKIDPIMYSGRSLYLAPSEPLAQQAYSVIARVLVKTKMAAIGQLAMSGRRQLILICEQNKLLRLHVLYYPNQVRRSPVTDASPARIVNGQLKSVEGFIKTAPAEIDWSNFRDKTADALKASVERQLTVVRRKNQSSRPIARNGKAVKINSSRRKARKAA